MRALVLSLVLPLLAMPTVARSAPVEVGLTPLLLQVEQRAPALRGAAATAAAARSGRRAAQSGYWGEVTLFGSDRHADDPQLVEPISPPVNIGGMAFDDDIATYGVRARLPLDVNGNLRAQVAAARGGERGARSDRDQLRLDLLNRAARLYHDLQRIAGERTALTLEKSALEEQARVAAAKVKVGRLPAVEVVRLRAEVAGVRGRLATLDGEEAAVRAGIAALLDGPGYTEAVVVEPWAPEAPRAADADTRERPDVRAARARVAAAKARLRGSHATRLPAMAVTATARHDQGWLGATGDHWQAEVEASLPLFDGGRRRRQVDGAAAEVAAAEARLALVQATARAEVATARGRWVAAGNGYQAAVDGLDAAAETATIQRDRFAVGRLSAADLVDAEATLAAARAAFTTALATWWQADDDYRLALGLEPAAYGTPASPAP